MALQTLVKRSEYHDSVTLMLTARDLLALPGVQDVAVVMATEANRVLLADAGLLTDVARTASANDLVICVKAADEVIAQATLAQAEALLKRKRETAAGAARRPRSLDAALQAAPDANIAVISVAGRYAAREARAALERGRHVFLFSDNVALEDEVALKQLARDKRLLLMGPDAGTAIINGVALGFANAVPRGPVGVVSAAGTGLQAVTSYLARDEVGVSQAIGVGGRDLSAEVGGLMFQVAVEALLADPQTEVLVLVSKPPEPAVAERVLALIQGSPKPGGGFNRRLPTVVCFLGGEKAPVEAVGAHFADTLAEAAAMAGALARGLPSGGLRSAVGGRLARSLRELRTTAVGQRERLAESQRFVRGLFAGGTFCYEAQVVLTTILGPVHSNTPLAPAHKLASPLVSVGHTCIDLGGDEFTQGRLHPMLDPTLRNQRLRREASDPLTGCILLDVVLGYGAHPDPAGDLAPVIVQARQWAERHGRYLPVVVSVCGTPGDPQGLADQEKKLRDAGALVVPTNAAAARLAGWICKRDA